MKRFDRYYNKDFPQEVVDFILDSENNNMSVEEFIIRLSSLNFEFDIDNFILLLARTFSHYSGYKLNIFINVINETDEFDFIKEEDNKTLLKDFIHYNIYSNILMTSNIFNLLKALDNKYGTKFQLFLSNEILKLDNIKFSNYKRYMKWVIDL